MPVVSYSAAAPAGPKDPKEVTVTPTELLLQGKVNSAACRKKCEEWALQNKITCGGYAIERLNNPSDDGTKRAARLVCKAFAGPVKVLPRRLTYTSSGLFGNFSVTDDGITCVGPPGNPCCSNARTSCYFKFLYGKDYPNFRLGCTG